MAKRKRKPRTISLSGATAKAPQSRQGRPPKEDATRTAIDARLRQAGKPDTPDNRKAMADPMQGCAIGRALAPMTDTDARADLWGAVCHMRGAYARYRSLIGLPSPHAVVANILAPTPAIETSADHPAPDLRPLEDRIRSATAAHMAVQGWLGYVDKHAASCTQAAVIYAPDEPIRDLAAVIRALQCVVDGIRGNRMIWRGATSS